MSFSSPETSPSPDGTPDSAAARPASPKCKGPVRVLLMFGGGLSLALGLIGLVLPVMPSTIFLLMALWCFSRSHPQLADWLYAHPRLGPPLRDWQQHRVVPVHAKVCAAVMMLASLAIVWFGTSGSIYVISSVGVIFAIVLGFLFSCPHKRPIHDSY